MPYFSFLANTGSSCRKRPPSAGDSFQLGCGARASLELSFGFLSRLAFFFAATAASSPASEAGSTSFLALFLFLGPLCLCLFLFAVAGVAGP